MIGINTSQGETNAGRVLAQAFEIVVVEPVVLAARLLADIAADGALIAEFGAGDRKGCLCQGSVFGQSRRIGSDSGQSGQGPDFQESAFFLDIGHRGNDGLQVYQVRGSVRRTHGPQVCKEIRAAGDRRSPSFRGGRSGLGYGCCVNVRKQIHFAYPPRWPYREP